MRRTFGRLDWYGAVIGSTVALVLAGGMKGLDGMDFTAGWLCAVLVMPFLCQRSEQQK